MPQSVGVTLSAGGGSKRKKLTVGDVFNQDDDEVTETKKRKLIPLDYDDDKSGSGADSGKPTSAEEKRQKIKGLIESIPTAKDELFTFPLDWSIVDQVSEHCFVLSFFSFTSEITQ
jgi:RNA-binding protein 25